MRVTVRPMTHNDLDSVVALEAGSQPRPWTLEVFQSELEGLRRAYLVAEDVGLVGFGGVMVVDRDAHITNLLVEPIARSSGIGTQLMVGLIRAGIELGAVNLTLEVRTRNEAARRLYSHFELAPVGVRKGYYGDDDALIMWAHDIDSPGYRSHLEQLASQSAEHRTQSAS